MPAKWRGQNRTRRDRYALPGRGLAEEMTESMARHAELTRPYELDQVAAAALFDLADAAPVRLPDPVRRGPAGVTGMERRRE